MKYLKSEFPIALALVILGLGFALEERAIEHGGIALWGLLLVILARSSAWRFASVTTPKCWRCAGANLMAR